MQLENLLRERAKSFLEIMDSEEWIFEKKKDGTSIFRMKPQDSNIHKIKGKVLVPASMEEIFDVLSKFPDSFQVLKFSNRR